MSCWRILAIALTLSTSIGFASSGCRPSQTRTGLRSPSVDGFQEGDAAPEIEGTDVQGIEFKLSDYRGKVVVVDFWGNW